MKDVLATLEESGIYDKKINRFSKQISLRYWIGWSGNYRFKEKES